MRNYLIPFLLAWNATAIVPGAAQETLPASPPAVLARSPAKLAVLTYSKNLGVHHRALTALANLKKLYALNKLDPGQAGLVLVDLAGKGSGEPWKGTFHIHGKDLPCVAMIVPTTSHTGQLRSAHRAFTDPFTASQEAFQALKERFPEMQIRFTDLNAPLQLKADAIRAYGEGNPKRAVEILLDYLNFVPGDSDAVMLLIKAREEIAANERWSADEAARKLAEEDAARRQQETARQAEERRHQQGSGFSFFKMVADLVLNGGQVDDILGALAPAEMTAPSAPPETAQPVQGAGTIRVTNDSPTAGVRLTAYEPYSDTSCGFMDIPPRASIWLWAGSEKLVVDPDWKLQVDSGEVVSLSDLFPRAWKNDHWEIRISSDKKALKASEATTTSP